MGTLHLGALVLAILSTYTITGCHSFCPSSCNLIHQPIRSAQRKGKHHRRPLFKELISDDGEDLRADITVIKKQDGFDNFLKVDDRLCVIKFYAPYCKACRAFGVKFRKLATDKGDRINAAGEAVQSGDARFGEIEYSSNIKLCKSLGIKKFPAVMIYRGGEESEKLGEIVCKRHAIDDIVAEMEQQM